jgi:hypothetical protein
MCFALNSYDDASDPAYVDGWQAGDNGGTGFTPWNFDSSYFWPVDGNWYPHENSEFHAIDDGLNNGTHYSNPFNNIGRAWAIGNAPINPDGEVRAGRGFSPLQIGDTLNVMFDNPTERQFFKGYIIRLNGGTGGANGNICANKAACTPMAPQPQEKLGFTRFEYFNDGAWNVYDAAPGATPTGLFDTDTAALGARISVTRTGADNYDVLIDPLSSASSYSASRTFAHSGVPIDWIEFVFFNSATDLGSPPTIATDLYIRSIEIVRAAAPGQPGDYNKDGTVNAADYVVWRDYQGQAFQLDNEVSGVTSGMVTPEDYTEWRARFGNTSASGTSSAVAVAAVPEPESRGCVVIATIGVVAVLAGSRRCPW